MASRGHHHTVLHLVAKATGKQFKGCEIHAGNIRDIDIANIFLRIRPHAKYRFRVRTLSVEVLTLTFSQSFTLQAKLGKYTNLNCLV